MSLIFRIKNFILLIVWGIRRFRKRDAVISTRHLIHRITQDRTENSLEIHQKPTIRCG